jgi:hypothetical protein
MKEISRYFGPDSLDQEMLENRVSEIMEAMFQEARNISQPDSAIAKTLRNYLVNNDGCC